MLFKRLIVSTTAIAAIGAGAVVTASPAGADPNVPGTYNSTGGVRVVDTRGGVGLTKARVASNQTVTFDVTDQLNAAADDAALDISITAVSPTSNGFLTVYQGGTARPSSSTVNYQAGRNTANSDVVRAGSDGTVNVFNGSAGTLDLVVDLNGYWTAPDDSNTDSAGALHTVTPQRLTDSRTGTALGAHASATVPVLGADDVPADNVSAVLVNVTAIGGSQGGFLSLSGDPESAGDRTSIVNFVARGVRGDFAPVMPNSDGAITIFNGSNVAANYFVDVVGYITDGAPDGDGAFLATSAQRVQDTRSGSAVPAYGTDKLALFPDDTFKAVAVTVTVVDARSGGFLTAYRGTGTVPPTSSVNHLAGEISSQTLLAPVNPDGSISIVNRSPGSVDLVVDVRGYVLNADPDGSMNAARIKAAITHQRHYAAQHVSR